MSRSYFRVRFAVRGGHIHCRLFVTANPKGTWAKSGDFVLSKGGEFRDFIAAFNSADIIAEDGEEMCIAEAVRS